MKQMCLGIALCLLVPAGALAQQTDIIYGPEPEQRGFVMGSGGLTFGSTETGALFGGEFGVSLGDTGLQVIGSATYLQNLMPGSVQDDLDAFGSLVSAWTGDRWEFDAKARAFDVQGGVRYLFPTGAAARPYVLGTAGFTNIKVTVKEIDLGEMTDDLINEGILTEDDIKATKPSMQVGGGVQIGAGAFIIDTALRYFKVFGLEDTNILRGQVGIGARF